jgi:hypothetical protein
MPVIFGVKNFLKLLHIIQLLCKAGKFIVGRADIGLTRNAALICLLFAFGAKKARKLHRYPLTKRQFA